jgi:anaerobic ribonucleoside-triphosphate reductase activating protein
LISASLAGGRRILRVAAYASGTRSEGPGSRFAIWLQGCSILCRGCCNPEMHDHSGGREMTVDDLVELSLDSGCEGITLLGGEPFDQAAGAALLALRVRAAGLGVVAFSGYTIADLRSMPQAAALLACTDLLKSGPFIESLKSSRRRWIGSENQEFTHLTGRYRGHPDIREDWTQGVSVDLSGDGLSSGWPLALRGE